MKVLNLNKENYDVFYKLFVIDKNGNMTSLYNSTMCKKKIFEKGKIYRVNTKPSIAESGFHFSKNLNDLKQYSPSLTRSDIAIGKIEVLGDLISYKTTYCSNKIKILKILDIDEIYDLLDKEKSYNIK